MSAGQTKILTGQMGHAHGMVAVQKWGRPAELLYVHWFFFLFPAMVQVLTLEVPREPFQDGSGHFLGTSATLVATTRVNGVNVFARIERKSEAFARDYQVDV